MCSFHSDLTSADWAGMLQALLFPQIQTLTEILLLTLKSWTYWIVCAHDIILTFPLKAGLSVFGLVKPF